ncbi:hypothetical protein ACFC26_39975 [Kitasatospora purpeofusca]|uniref:hypothetical protein n=1 Tax=Kitasatospora purpeofusca TaxID=67352 RepID=UPI0035DA918B
MRPYTFFPASNPRLAARTAAAFTDWASMTPAVGSGIAARRLADPIPQPVVELGDQDLVAPAPEERVDAVPGGEVRGHRPPGDAARDRVAYRVDHLPGRQ